MNKVFVIQEKFIKITKFLDYGNLEISSLKLSSAGIIDDNLMNLVYSYKIAVDNFQNDLLPCSCSINFHGQKFC